MSELGPRGSGPEHRVLRVGEVTLSELNHGASDVVRRVEGGELAVVSRHGRPVAVIVPITEAVLWAPPEVTSGEDGRPLGEEFERRAHRRYWSNMMHGRHWTHNEPERGR